MNVATSPDARSIADERFFTVDEVANMWRLSSIAVRRLFLCEPGVLVIGQQEARRRKRVYRTLRIPESVLGRVRARLANRA